MKIRSTLLFHAFAVALLMALTLATAAAQSLPAWSKWHYDQGNTGWNPLETALNTTNVNQNTFGKLWQRKVRGQVYAQPLYVANVDIPRYGKRNCIYVATESNYVYCFDADRADGLFARPYWQAWLGPSAPTANVGSGDVTPEYGITSTPVIDVATHTIYIVPKTLEFDKNLEWRLHALDIRSGKPRKDWGFAIRGTTPGNGGGNVNGVITFDQSIQFSRAGLTIANGRIYVAFGSHGDQQIDKYHGWIFSYNLSNPNAPMQVWNSSPDSNGTGQAANGIWMSGASPAVDADGNLYFTTGNGPFDGHLGGHNLGDSVVRLQTGGGTGLFFSGDIADYFSPNDQEFLRQVDLDLGSGGTMIVPPQNDTGTPNLLLAGGKDSRLHLINRDFFGGFSGDPMLPDNTLQTIGGWEGMLYSTPAYWSGPGGNYAYVQSNFGPLRQFKIATSMIGLSSLNLVATAPDICGYPAGTPTISSDGSKAGTGIAWLLNRETGALHAYDAADVSKSLFNSNEYYGRDFIGDVVKFTTPTVANGKVFVATDGYVTAFGLNPPVVTTPNKFVIIGPLAVNSGVANRFQLSALDPKGNPMRITRTVRIMLRQPNGAIITAITLNFNNESSKIWTGTYSVVGSSLFLAELGTPVETKFQFAVRPPFQAGANSFYVTVPATVTAGQEFNATVTAFDVNGKKVPYTGIVSLKFTRVDGTLEDAGTLTFNGETALTAKVTLSGANNGLGPRIAIATDNIRTGTSVTKLDP